MSHRDAPLLMAHLFTIRVPKQYRCAGRGLVGLAVFQADDHVAVLIPGVMEVIAGGQPPAHDGTAALYWAAVTAYGRHRHPQERYREDLINGGWAWIWLTETELEAPPGPLPDLAARVPDYPGFHGECPADGGTTDWDDSDQPAAPLLLVPRVDDPNVGMAIEDDDPAESAKLIEEGWEAPAGYVHSGYIPMFSEEGDRFGLTDRFFGESHFGGTAEYQNGGEPFPRLGPRYIAFDAKLCGVNVGDAVARIDLFTDRIEWSS
ncbi:hypothetical protein [Streptomyces bobili]|uniref:hypothetical protein n=1 Tax=Streptomyces bobili TaxID=67280 RepID=UPI0037FC9B92